MAVSSEAPADYITEFNDAMRANLRPSWRGTPLLHELAGRLFHSPGLAYSRPNRDSSNPATPNWRELKRVWRPLVPRRTPHSVLWQLLLQLANLIGQVVESS